MLESLFEPLTSAGYDWDLITDLYRILFTGYGEVEKQFILLVILLATAPLARRLW